MSDHGLIVDIGMHRGEDTEFYLAKGFRVLAIEASPDLVAEVVQRLAPHIASGRLEVLNVAVAEQPGELEFYVSGREGWGSARKDWAEARAALGIESHAVTVASDTMANIMRGRERAHYVKIDIEGADGLCIRGLADVEKPTYISVECDPIDRAETLEMLSILEGYGYTRFKLVNQARNPRLRCPNPPLEGDFCDARFSHYSSGLFGAESPGEWVSVGEIREQYLQISRQQALRSSYTATGRLWGIPVGRFHRQLERVYNARPVRAAREGYARVRGIETGGWFDLHAAP